MVDFSYLIIACEYLLVSLLNFYVLFFIKQLLKVQNMNIARDKNTKIRYRLETRAKTPQGGKPKKILFLLNKIKLIYPRPKTKTNTAIKVQVVPPSSHLQQIIVNESQHWSNLRILVIS